MGKGSRSKESEALTETFTDNEEDTELDPKILDMFDNVRLVTEYVVVVIFPEYSLYCNY